MTTTEYQQKYGPDLAKFIASPAWVALQSVLDTEGPVGSAPERTPGDIVLGGHVLYSQIHGFQLCRSMIFNCQPGAIQKQPEPDYSESELERSENSPDT